MFSAARNSFIGRGDHSDYASLVLAASRDQNWALIGDQRGFGVGTGTGMGMGAAVEPASENPSSCCSAESGKRPSGQDNNSSSSSSKCSWSRQRSRRISRDSSLAQSALGESEPSERGWQPQSADWRLGVADASSGGRPLTLAADSAKARAAGREHERTIMHNLSHKPDQNRLFEPRIATLANDYADTRSDQRGLAPAPAGRALAEPYQYGRRNPERPSQNSHYYYKIANEHLYCGLNTLRASQPARARAGSPMAHFKSDQLNQSFHTLVDKMDERQFYQLNSSSPSYELPYLSARFAGSAANQKSAYLRRSSSSSAVDSELDRTGGRPPCKAGRHWFALVELLRSGRALCLLVGLLLIALAALSLAALLATSRQRPLGASADNKGKQPCWFNGRRSHRKRRPAERVKRARKSFARGDEGQSNY